ncbi:unnamed protein product [Polarella glacialis]|uniref:Uncharacterized protein n=1 Tax=Polarella glacialis TaxID=89957 RepID=A0A813GZM9_POLGL|nr:unnamed protein product [Polarella glacialis]
MPTPAPQPGHGPDPDGRHRRSRSRWASPQCRLRSRSCSRHRRSSKPGFKKGCSSRSCCKCHHRSLSSRSSCTPERSEKHSPDQQQQEEEGPGPGSVPTRTWPIHSARLGLGRRPTRLLQRLHAELLQADLEKAAKDVESSQSCSWGEAHRLKANIVLRELREACGYGSDDLCFPWRVAQDFRCCQLFPRSRSGLSLDEQNMRYGVGNHYDMIRDTVRVKAYKQAISRVARGKTVLDVGSGAFCLLGRIALKAGALRVDTVESSVMAVVHAVDMFQLEISGQGALFELVLNDEEEAAFKWLRYLQSLETAGGAFDAYRMKLSIKQKMFPTRFGGKNVKEGEDDSDGWQLEALSKTKVAARDACCTLQLFPEIGLAEQPESFLQVYHGLSNEVDLPGPYDVVVHEILGHVASCEGVSLTIADLVDRRLCNPGCVFVPAAAGTLFAPTAQLQLSQLEQILNCYHNGECSLKPQTKYHAVRFDPDALLSASQTFEWLNFCAPSSELKGCQERSVVFVTSRDALFDGLHFHLLVNLDETTTIDTLESETTWNTTYVKLVDVGVWLPKGSRILCHCDTRYLGSRHCYSVSVLIGEAGQETFFADFSWEGCS